MKIEEDQNYQSFASGDLIGWKENILKNIVDIRVSNVDKKIYSSKSLVRLCNYMDAYSNDYISNYLPYSTGSADANEIQKFGLKYDDVIITKDSETPDDIAISSVVVEELENVVCGYHLAILRPDKNEISGRFLMLKLKQPDLKAYFFSVANGSTRYGLTIGNIEQTRIKYPPLHEQNRIAQILSTTDAVIGKTQAAIAKYKAIKQGMLHDLFTRGIDINTGKLRPICDDAPDLYKESKLGMVPKEWEMDFLGNCINVSSGAGLTQNNIKQGYHPVYGGNGINGYHAEYLFKEEKLIIGRVGEYCGNAFITRPFSWITDNALIVSNLEKKFNLNYWVVYLNYLDLNSIAFAAAQPVITGGIISKVPIIKTPIDEREIITQKIQSIDNNLETEQT